MSGVPSRVVFLRGEAGRSFRAAAALSRLALAVPSGAGGVVRREFLLGASDTPWSQGMEFDWLAGGCVDPDGGPPATAGSTEPLAGEGRL